MNDDAATQFLDRQAKRLLVLPRLVPELRDNRVHDLHGFVAKDRFAELTEVEAPFFERHVEALAAVNGFRVVPRLSARHDAASVRLGPEACRSTETCCDTSEKEELGEMSHMHDGAADVGLEE